MVVPWHCVGCCAGCARARSVQPCYCSLGRRASKKRPCCQILEEPGSGLVVVGGDLQEAARTSVG